MTNRRYFAARHLPWMIGFRRIRRGVPVVPGLGRSALQPTPVLSAKPHQPGAPLRPQAHPFHRWRAGRLAWTVWVLGFLFFGRALFAADVQVHLLALGDWGAGTSDQSAVASAMADYAGRDGVKLDAVLLLGDNFYDELDGVNDRAWKKLFEEMYDSKRLAVPFYAVLGNHDFEENKAQIEFDYAKKNPQSRFKMPDFWYRVDLPPDQPLVTLLALTSDTEEISKEQWAAQTRWLEAELAKPNAARWTICFAHHPLFSDSEHGDEEKLQKDWGPLLKKHDVDFYLSGHDHTLQHLQMPGWPTTFIVSGAGGKEVYEIERKKRRAKFARSEYGFVHLQFTRDQARIHFINKKSEKLHVFERQPEGAIKVVTRSSLKQETP